MNQEPSWFTWRVICEDGDVRISILGVGSVGSVFAAKLAGTSHELHLHVRGDRGADLMVNGIQVSGHGLAHVPADRFTFTCEELDLHPSFRNGSDLVLLACKSHVVGSLASLASTLLKDDGVVLALSNGLGHVETLIRTVGANHVVAATTTHGAYTEANGDVVWAGRGQLGLAIPPLGASADELNILVFLFEQYGLSPVVHPDASSMVWEKVLLNVAINPVAALAGLRNGELLEPALFGTCMMVFREAAQVAALERIDVPDEVDFERHLRKVLEQTKDNSCSMLQDIKAGRPTEIGSLNQAIALRAEDHGYHVPLNQLLVTLVQACHP